MSEYINLVAELNSLRLARGILSAGAVRIRGNSNFEDAQILNFDEEECRSFLLSFRMLIQNNDRISLQCVARIIQAGDFSEECKAKIESERDLINMTLDNYCPLLSSGGAQGTCRDLFETFLWGSYAHRGMNLELRARFLEWEAQAAQFLHKKSVFLLILRTVLQAATKISGYLSNELNNQQNGREAE